MFVQSNIPVPPKPILGGRKKSELRIAVENLHINQCVTVPAKDEKDQRKKSQRVNALATTVRRRFTDRRFTVRQMLGEIDGELHPVVRIWRTA